MANNPYASYISRISPTRIYLTEGSEDFRQFKKHFDTKIAPQHSKAFEEDVHNHLTSHGFKQVHDGPKRSIYTKTDPIAEHHHTVTVNKSKGPSEYNSHRTEIRYQNHGGASHSSIVYAPDSFNHYKEKESHGNKRETEARASAISQLHKLHTGHSFRIPD